MFDFLLSSWGIGAGHLASDPGASFTSSRLDDQPDDNYDYQAIDEVTPDIDTTYLYDITTDFYARQTWAHTNWTVTGDIDSVWLIVRARQTF
jgi:hypothetical protein